MEVVEVEPDVIRSNLFEARLVGDTDSVLEAVMVVVVGSLV